jgi:hypothetical protein
MGIPSGMEMMLGAAIKSLGLDPEEIKAKVESIGKMATDANEKFGTLQTNETLMIQILQTIVANQNKEMEILKVIAAAMATQSMENNDHGNSGSNSQPN